LRVLKWIFIIFALFVGAIYAMLKSDSLFQSVAKNLIAQSGIDLKYKSLSGSPLNGLSIRGFDYENKIKGDAKLKLNWAALKDNRLEIDDLNISNLRIEKDFLDSLLDQNSSSKNSSNKSSSLKEISIKKAHIDLKDIVFKEYKISSLDLDIDGLKSNLTDSHSGNIKLKADTNAGKIDAIIKLKDSRYKMSASIKPKEDFLKRYLSDTNITLKSSPLINLKADGDMNDLNYEIFLSKGEFGFDDISIYPESISASGVFGIKSRDLTLLLNGHIKSSVADVDLNSNSFLNIDDLNSSLKSSTKIKLISDNRRLAPYIKDQNLSIISLAPLQADINASMREADIDLWLDRSVLKYKDELLKLKLDKSHIKYLPKTKDLTLQSNLKLDSNISEIGTNLRAKVNFNDINETLKYQLDSNALIKKALFKSLADEQNISISKLSPLKVKVLGDAKKIKADILMDGSLKVGELKLWPSLQNTNIIYDLISHDVNSLFDLKIKSNKGNLRLKNIISLNTDDINNTLHFKTEGLIKDTKEFKGVNLSPLGDISLNGVGDLKDIKIWLNSKILTAAIKSKDLDQFDFNFDIKRVKLSKIYKKLPQNLQKSALALDGRGSYKISKSELELDSKLKEFDFNGRKISTNRFSLKSSKESLTLTPTIIRAGDFSLNIGVKKVADEFVATLKNKAFKAKARIKTDPLFINADGKITSIKEAVKQISKIYPIKLGFDIDGSVDFKVRSKGESISAVITSPKITFEQGRAEKLNIEALYQPNKIILKRFEFWQKGFSDKKMNRFVRLKRDGIITFNDQNASIDIDIINLGKFKAKKIGDTIDANIDVNHFYLHIPKYIKTTLSSHLKFFQSKEKKSITGEIEFKDSEVNYESRYLDVSKDSDIIIVNGKNESDDFIKNTFLDIKIYSDDEIVYKVQAGEVKLKPDIVVRKDFGDTPRITGRIKILDGGEYDLADKRFYIKDGAVAFRGLKEINPLLDLHVAYEDLDEIKIFIDILGDKNRPRLKFSSKPPRSKKDIFSYLLFGMSASESEGAMSSANKAAERIFGRAISKDLARELHLDRLDLNRNSLGGIDIKAGKKVGKKTIIYYQNKSTQSSVIVERKLSKDWDISVEAGKEGEAVDFVYRKGFK